MTLPSQPDVCLLSHRPERRQHYCDVCFRLHKICSTSEMSGRPPVHDTVLYHARVLFCTFHCSALFTQTRGFVVFQCFSLFFFFTRVSTYGFVAWKKEKVWKTHLCGKYRGSHTWLVSDTKTLCAAPLCTAGQGCNALLSRVLVWDCSFKAPMSWEKFMGKTKTSYTHTCTHTLTIP